MGGLQQFILHEESASYWRVVFENPPLNLVNPDTLVQLRQLVGRIEAAPELKVVLFESANPDYFLAHYDMARAAEKVDGGGAVESPWIDFATRLAYAPVVSIASVRGRARGIGNEFLMACDLRFASIERAIFGQPEIGVGIMPGGGALERLPLLVGRSRALEIIVGADDLDATTAERYGLVNRAIPDAELDAVVLNLVRRIASFDKQTIAESKSALNRKGIPDLADLRSSQDLFRSSIGWSGARTRLKTLVERGLGQHGDCELRLGHHLGSL
ncbi:enoyl-CoA hydratase/carnithine racemase [Paraburkholderia sp. EB58]|jgi:enoyl-CoA hydratase/carnithine racemase|uniref:enoyl-CoA hydratase/isomerase family protein n=1 Tax=Paraburkholderia sp. EB58 TaxID=3035125 RepID=UPI003D1D64F4